MSRMNQSFEAGDGVVQTILKLRVQSVAGGTHIILFLVNFQTITSNKNMSSDDQHGDDSDNNSLLDLTRQVVKGRKATSCEDCNFKDWIPGHVCYIEEHDGCRIHLCVKCAKARGHSIEPEDEAEAQEEETCPDPAETKIDPPVVDKVKEEKEKLSDPVNTNIDPEDEAFVKKQ
jgi:hypothetical protein